MTAQAEAVKEAADILNQTVKDYNNMISTYELYRTDSLTNRIIHRIDFDKGILTYDVGAARRMGYNYKGKQTE